jgi:large subunit ribosomal protein L24
MERLKVGDLVQVISGKEKGKQGKITKILKDEGRVVVEGVRVQTRHMKPSQWSQGGKITKEAAIDASKVMPVDPETQKPTRVKVKVVDGKKVRVAKSGATLGAQG